MKLTGGFAGRMLCLLLLLAAPARLRADCSGLSAGACDSGSSTEVSLNNEQTGTIVLIAVGVGLGIYLGYLLVKAIDQSDARFGFYALPFPRFAGFFSGEKSVLSADNGLFSPPRLTSAASSDFSLAIGGTRW